MDEVSVANRAMATGIVIEARPKTFEACYEPHARFAQGLLGRRRKGGRFAVSRELVDRQHRVRGLEFVGCDSPGLPAVVKGLEQVYGASVRQRVVGQAGLIALCCNRFGVDEIGRWVLRLCGGFS